MTDWCGAADMTPEELKKALDDMKDKVVNFHKYQPRVASRQDRTYASQRRGVGIGSPMRRIPRKASKSWMRTGDYV